MPVGVVGFCDSLHTPTYSVGLGKVQNTLVIASTYAYRPKFFVYRVATLNIPNDQPQKIYLVYAYQLGPLSSPEQQPNLLLE